MKKCLSPNDLGELSETRKNALRRLWQPCKYDLAFEIVWRDVENDIYDAVIIMILDAKAVTTPRDCEVVLRVWYPDGAPQYESPVSMPDEDEENNNDGDPNNEENNDIPTGNSDNIERAISVQAELPANHYLSIENCLPLLNIGQMIEILRQRKGEPEISFTPAESICYVGGEEFSGEEMCDALWEAVKTLL